MDILSRCVNAGLCLSNGLRRDTQLWFILQGPPGPDITLRIDGTRARYINPDERSTAALMRHSLIKLEEEERREARALENVATQTQNGEEVKTAVALDEIGDTKTRPTEYERTPGIFISRTGLDTALDRLMEAGTRFLLMEENGTPLNQALTDLELKITPNEERTDTTWAPAFAMEPKLTFVLGDDKDPTEDELKLLEKCDVIETSLGPNSLLSSHCLILIHNELDQLSQETTGE